MSTRSAIIVKGVSQYKKGESSYYRLYKHSDGYPTGNLPVIQSAIAHTISLYKEYEIEMGEPRKYILPEVVAGFVASESISVYGTGAKLELVTASAKDASGNQGDIEWTYLIDIENKNVDIYKSSVMEEETTSPEEYVKCLIASYQADELRETQKMVRSIRALGFTVNGK